MYANIFLTPFTHCFCCSGQQRGWSWWAVLFGSTGILPVRKRGEAAFAHLTFALI